MTNLDLEQQAMRDLEALARNPERVSLEIRPIDAWLMLSNLQLALRHPSNTSDASIRVEQLARRLQELVARTPALAAVAERGWFDAFDVPRDEPAVQRQIREQLLHHVADDYAAARDRWYAAAMHMLAALNDIQRMAQTQSDKTDTMIDASWIEQAATSAIEKAVEITRLDGRPGADRWLWQELAHRMGSDEAEKLRHLYEQVLRGEGSGT